MATMRAAVLIEPKRFEIEERAVPQVGADEVLIKVTRCGICGTDVHIFKGNYASENLPLVPGHEFTGVVADKGSDVDHFQPGQKVVVDINIGCRNCYWCRRNEVFSCPQMQQLGITCDGAFAEYVVAPAHLVIAAQEQVSDDVLALTEPVACVVRSARKSKVRFGESVVVLGAGPIGNLHVQMMRLVGAAPIIVADLSEQRAEFAMEVGADVIVTDPTKLKDTVLSMTGGRGADVVIESVGQVALYEQAFALIRKGGRVAAFGITGPDDEISLNVLQTILEENSIKGSVAGMGQDMHDALALLTHGRFNVTRFTGAEYPLDQIQHAFESLADRPQDLKTQIVF